VTRYVLPPLPATWTTFSLGELTNIQYGKALQADLRKEGGTIPVYGSGGIVGYHDSALHETPSLVIGRKGSVGATFQVEEPFWCIDTAFYLDELNSEVDIGFLAKYLAAINLSQLTIVVGVPGLNRNDLASVPVPLPTLPEQKRIVELIKYAEQIAFAHEGFGEDTQAILHAALDGVLFSDTEPGTQQLGDVAETRYGTSVSADADETTGVPVLRIPNVVTGEINTANLKYVSLVPEEIDRLALSYGDVLVVRSNGNPNYVGRSAPVNNLIANSQYVYASYLIRLRLDIGRLLPEYLSSFFNSPYGRVAMRNAIRTTAGQSNISGESLSRLKVPLPLIEQQQLFAKFWNSLQDLRGIVDNAEQSGRSLLETVKLDAFSGTLTEDWRVRNQAELDQADNERRLALGPSARRRTKAITEYARPEQDVGYMHPARTWLLEQLSEFQRNVRIAVQEWRATVTPDDAESFDDFCRQRAIQHFENAKDRVRRALEQLAALGLVANLSLQNATGNFVIGYRPLREDEDTRLADVQRLQSRLSNAPSDQETE
jgi:type I restriction enzyme, S subunit